MAPILVIPLHRWGSLALLFNHMKTMLICSSTKLYVTILLFTEVKVASGAYLLSRKATTHDYIWCPLHFPELAEVSPRTHTREGSLLAG